MNKDPVPACEVPGCPGDERYQLRRGLCQRCYQAAKNRAQHELTVRHGAEYDALFTEIVANMKVTGRT